MKINKPLKILQAACALGLVMPMHDTFAVEANPEYHLNKNKKSFTQYFKEAYSHQEVVLNKLSNKVESIKEKIENKGPVDNGGDINNLVSLGLIRKSLKNKWYSSHNSPIHCLNDIMNYRKKAASMMALIKARLDFGSHPDHLHNLNKNSTVYDVIWQINNPDYIDQKSKFYTSFYQPLEELKTKLEQFDQELESLKAYTVWEEPSSIWNGEPLKKRTVFSDSLSNLYYHLFDLLYYGYGEVNGQYGRGYTVHGKISKKNPTIESLSKKEFIDFYELQRSDREKQEENQHKITTAYKKLLNSFENKPEFLETTTLMKSLVKDREWIANQLPSLLAFVDYIEQPIEGLFPIQNNETTQNLYLAVKTIEEDLRNLDLTMNFIVVNAETNTVLNLNLKKIKDVVENIKNTRNIIKNRTAWGMVGNRTIFGDPR